MRRIAGVDINGWKDMAARDWSPDEEDAEKGKVFIVDGGVGSVAVRQDIRYLGRRTAGGPFSSRARRRLGRAGLTRSQSRSLLPSSMTS